VLYDAKLIRRLHNGDEASFEAIFLQHYKHIYGVLFHLLGNKADAEDITQQVFLKLYHSPERLQVQDGGTNVVGWLYRVAVNEGYNALRSRKRRIAWHTKFSQLWLLSNPVPNPAQLVESQDTQARVRQILAEMKPREAKLLLLRHMGLSYKELAAVLNIVPGSVGSLLTQAKRTFAKKYRSAFPEKE
jgi:RNA polymerase sigma-70 factor (ECF subfamily)